jgi:prepilin-type N-terminal cleavage/methylation domain-containing protein
MKLLTDKLVSPRCGQAAQTGFTLAEMMIALAVFSLAMIAMIGVQIFGLRVYTLSSSKMIATTGGRQLLDKMRDPIRSANTVVVGFYNNNSFTSVTNGAPQIGNAILISMVTNAFTAQNSIVFYHDMASSSLRIVTNNGNTVLANSITNDFCFQAEDFRGNLLSNYLNNPVIRVDLGFIQWNFNSGSSGYYNLYHLQTRVARRPK